MVFRGLGLSGLLWLILSTPGWSYDNLQRPSGVTAFDLVQRLAEGGDPSQMWQSLFADGVMANLNIPSDHVRVIFYDAQTGQQLPREHIRQLMGATPHDGMVEMLFIAEEMAGGSLPMEIGQLVALMDASYLASMRRPPAIDVEFYDVRCGPQGLRGGGVSGSRPDQPCEPATRSYGRSTPQAEAGRKSAGASAPTQSAPRSSDRWGLDVSDAVHLPGSQRPSSQRAQLARLQALDLRPSHWQDNETLPVIVTGRDEAELIASGTAVLSEMDRLGLVDVEEGPIHMEIYGEEWLHVYFYLRTEAQGGKKPSGF